MRIMNPPVTKPIIVRANNGIAGPIITFVITPSLSVAAIPLKTNGVSVRIATRLTQGTSNVLNFLKIHIHFQGMHRKVERGKNSTRSQKRV
jgi:hypothetical protein